MNILFDSMGVQVQVQQETGNRLTTWTGSLQSAGYTLNYTDYTQPIRPQLDGNDVLVILTRQWAQAPSTATGSCPPPNPPPVPNKIPQSTNFSYDSADLGDIMTWIHGGKGLLLFTNHTEDYPDGPYWPIYDIQLAAALGITTVYAWFGMSQLTMAPNPSAPAALINGVSSIAAADSGGIVPGNGTVLVPLPSGAQDSGPFDYPANAHAFAVLYPFGQGRVIVLGHSGIAANAGTCYPSIGQIDVADNQTFLNNCIAYLGAA